MTYITCEIWWNELRDGWTIPQDKGNPWTVCSSTFSEINCVCLAFLGLFRVLNIVNSTFGIILSNYLTRFPGFSKVQPKRNLYESYDIVLNVLPLKIVNLVAAVILGGGNISERAVEHFLMQLGEVGDFSRPMRCLKSHFWGMTESLKWLSYINAQSNH